MSAEEKKTKLERIIRVTYKIGVFIAVLLILGAFISDIITNQYYIKDIDATLIQKELSIDDRELNSRLKDEMDHIYHMANSLKETHPNLNSVANPFTVDVGGVSTSYFTLVDFVKYKLGRPYHGISASIYADGNKHLYRTRMGSHLIEHHAMDFDSLYDTSDILDTLMHRMALGIISFTDPYIASMYHFKRGKYMECIQLARLSLTRDPSARKYALGTIANTYTALGDYEEAEKHYLKCIREFPKFYPIYWRYGQLLEKTGRYAEAEENYLKTYHRGKKLKKAALGSLLTLACSQKDQQKFASYKQDYLRIGEEEDLETLNGIKICL